EELQGLRRPPSERHRLPILSGYPPTRSAADGKGAAMRNSRTGMEHHLAPAGLAPGKGYSHAVSATGRMVAIAGQVAMDARGELDDGILGRMNAEGRRTAAREVAALLPNLFGLFKGLVRDPRVPRGSKALLLFGAAWVASPIDLIPEFIPVLGPLDDAVVAAL